MTTSDRGKTVSIKGSSLTVDGEARKVTWNGDAHPDCKNKKLESVSSTRFRVENGQFYATPFIDAGDDFQVDLAFAAMDSSADSDEMIARFFMPVARSDPYTSQQTTLSDAREVEFGDLKFSHFTGAKRH